jgi:hypothetical protein
MRHRVAPDEQEPIHTRWLISRRRSGFSMTMAAGRAGVMASGFHALMSRTGEETT